MELLGLRIALVVSVIGTVVFIVDYTRLTKWGCWRDPVGSTLIIEALFALGYLVPLLLSSFFKLSVLATTVGVWSLICFIGFGGIVLLWRTLMFEKIARRNKAAGGTGTVPVEELAE